MKILLVEDDLDLLDVTAYALRRERFAVVEATDGAQALQRWRTERPDLVVLDLTLPRQDGFEVLRRVREADSTPVLVITGRNEEQDVLRCFTLGADDYMTKPFRPKELAMRLRAILRRVNGGEIKETPAVLEAGDLQLDLELHEVTRGGRVVQLTPIEFRIFHLLALNAGRVVTTERIFAFVWGHDGGDTNALRSHISHIRAKLQLPRSAITCVPSLGYALRPPQPARAPSTVSAQAAQTLAP